MQFLWHGIVKKMGGKSETLAMIMPLSLRPHTEFAPMFSERKIANRKDLQSLRFSRLEYTPYNDFFAAGSWCHVIFYNEKPIAFGWTHLNSHKCEHVGTIELDKDKVWTGPHFVHKDFRGQGLQKKLLSLCMQDAPYGTKYLLSSIASKNLPSIANFKKMGFEVAGKIISQDAGPFLHSRQIKIDISPKYQDSYRITGEPKRNKHQ